MSVPTSTLKRESAAVRDMPNEFRVCAPAIAAASRKSSGKRRGRAESRLRVEVAEQDMWVQSS